MELSSEKLVVNYIVAEREDRRRFSEFSIFVLITVVTNFTFENNRGKFIQCMVRTLFAILCLCIFMSEWNCEC
jgi:hypothetical protein